MRRSFFLLLLTLFFAVSCANGGAGERPQTSPSPGPETSGETVTENEEEKTVTERIFFVDPSAKEPGTGGADAPFSSLEAAFAACGEGGTVVLSAPVALAGDYTPPAHAGRVTLTAEKNGRLRLTDGCRFTLAGDTVFDLPIELEGKAVFTADFHEIVFERGAVTEGRGEAILIGGSNGGRDSARDVRITVKNGRFSEITGGSRYGKDRVYPGTVYLTVAGKAEIGKIFVGPWGEGAYRYADAEVLLDGGRIATFLCGTHGKDDRCTGSFSLYVTDRFDAEKSFSSPQGSSFGVSGTCPNPWGPAQDARALGDIAFYAETGNFASLISRILCDTTSFDRLVKIRGRLFSGEEGSAQDAARLFEERGIDPAGADRNGDGRITLADLVLLQNAESPLSGTDVYRPVYHYSPAKDFLADPNGLVYDAAAGIYHMYYQRQAGILRDRARSAWGHAISRDLIHWEEQEGLALSFGHTESGSAVVDCANTSGLFDESTPPDQRLVAVFSRSEAGVERQMIACSKDGGTTYRPVGTVIATSAYVTAENKAFRDPKVLWYTDPSEPAGGIWVMVVGGGRVQLFSSHDLHHWKAESAAEGKNGEAIYSECPDLFPLVTEEGEEKWILSCAGVSYYVGALSRDADGTFRFRAQQDKLPCNGTSAVKGVYAAQSFYNDASGRRVWINWMPDKSAPLLAGDKEWDGLMTLPYELALIRSGGRFLLCQTPVEETDALFGEPVFSAGAAPLSSLSLPDVPGNAYRLDVTLDLREASTACFEVRKGAGETTRILYDKRTGRLSLSTARSGELAGTASYPFTGGTYTAALAPDAEGKVRLRVYVDTVSVEVFGGEGEAVISATVFPDAGSSSLSASGDAAVLALSLCPAK